MSDRHARNVSAAMANIIPVGNQHRPSEIWLVRTERQRAAVRKIVSSEDFDFACNNPFTADITYTGPFVFVYRTVDGTLHLVRFSRKGNVIRRYSIDSHEQDLREVKQK